MVENIEAYDWPALSQTLDEDGWAVLPEILTPDECHNTRQLYENRSLFRSRVVMQRHGFGQGEYCYFSYPLPDLAQTLRTKLYPFIAPIANNWMYRMGLPTQFPHDHASFLQQCHSNGQTRPTPLLLKYTQGDYNCLHQDLYGDHVFPLQVAVLLSSQQEDFSGGEFVLTEQRPRLQSRASVVPLTMGDAVLFAVNQRPKSGTRGNYRVTMRHGVSRIRQGTRYTMGIIFHDAAANGH